MNRKKKTAVFVATGALVLGALGFWLWVKLSFRMIAGPMLQRVSTTGFAVVWRTTTQAPGWLSVTHDGKKVAHVPATYENGQFVAAVAQLEPGQTYEYSLSHTIGPMNLSTGGSWSCRTDPGPAFPFRLLAFGDSGTGGKSQYQLAERMIPYRPDLIIHTGDVIYPRGAAEDYPRKFFRPYAPLLPRAALMAVIGNHDYVDHGGRPLLDVFVLPANGPAGTEPERHYWFDYGCARFAAFDSDVDESELREKVAPWIRQVFTSAGTKWRVVFFHHPPYTGADKHLPDSRVRTLIVPELERSRVDIVFNGHNHLYERSRPISGDNVVAEAEGIVYIVTGAGGANRYAMAGPASRPAYTEAYFDSDFSFTVVDFSTGSVKLRQVDARGREVDRLELNRGPRSSVGGRPVAP